VAAAAALQVAVHQDVTVGAAQVLVAMFVCMAGLVNGLPHGKAYAK
jgi:hypothetical protein